MKVTFAFCCLKVVISCHIVLWGGKRRLTVGKTSFLSLQRNKGITKIISS